MTKDKIKGYSLTLADLLSEKKGIDVVVIDVESVTPLFDFLIISSATSILHLKALARYIDDKLQEFHIRKYHPIDYTGESPWILIDCGFLVIHLFLEEARDFYSLEKLWVDGQKIYQDEEQLEEEILVK